MSIRQSTTLLQGWCHKALVIGMDCQVAITLPIWKTTSEIPWLMTGIPKSWHNQSKSDVEKLKIGNPSMHLHHHRVRLLVFEDHSRPHQLHKTSIHWRSEPGKKPNLTDGSGHAMAPWHPSGRPSFFSFFCLTGYWDYPIIPSNVYVTWFFVNMLLHNNDLHFHLRSYASYAVLANCLTFLFAWPGIQMAAAGCDHWMDHTVTQLFDFGGVLKHKTPLSQLPFRLSFEETRFTKPASSEKPQFHEVGLRGRIPCLIRQTSFGSFRILRRHLAVWT